MEKVVGLPVKHVSETAFLVAAWRAVESERPDAVVHDPLADVLAGPEGRQLIETVGGVPGGDYMMAMRTSILDELILKQVHAGVDTVLNLAAGLDTRPYRLDVPSSLHWIEADFAGITDFKENRLAGHTPVCRLTRERVDLSVAAEREALFTKLATTSKRTLVLTEGLLYYLQEGDVLALSNVLANHPSVEKWMMDLVDGRLFARFSQEEKNLAADDVRFTFMPSLPYFEKLGWKVDVFRSFQDQGKALRREPPAALTQGNPIFDEASRNTGIAQLSR